MANNPSVACVMLANGRPEMTARAIESFLTQTYQNKKLLVLDGSPYPMQNGIGNINVWKLSQFEPPAIRTIGALRNLANGLTEEDIICHWDSDDWSHPRRVEEQVSLLQSSGAECVGYNEMLFWRENFAAMETHYTGDGTTQSDPVIGQAWLYRSAIRDNYALGTSMCYWSDTWRRHTFPDRSEGCDDLYWSAGNRVKIASQSSLPVYPMMIASIHGSNTCARLDVGKKEWMRVTDWDSYCMERMKL